MTTQGDIDRIASMISQREHRSTTQMKWGWQQHVRAEPAVPPSYTPAQYSRLSPSGRAKYDEDRLRFHLELDRIETTQMRQAEAVLNQHLQALVADSAVARPGVMISGVAYTGKSTIAVMWARKVELALRRAQGLLLPDDPELAVPRLPGGAEYLPVVYFSLADSVGGSLRNGLRFFDPVIPKRSPSIDEMLARLARLVQACGTRILILDQVHEIAKRGPAEVSEAIKQLMDNCPSTLIVGAGIGVEQTAIFSDGHSRGKAQLGQTGGRFSLVPVNPFDPLDPQSMDDWAVLLTTMEKELRLTKAQPGDILQLSNEILRRTYGLTGVVMTLVRGAANLAITTGTERITKKVLDGISLNAFSDLQSGHTEPPRSPAGLSRPKKAA